MSETTKNSLMIVASIIAGVIVIASGFFLFSNFMDTIIEQRQSEEFINLEGQISRVCQQIKLNPNNEFSGERFFLIVYEPYKIWYEKTPSQEVERVCKAARCVCFSRIDSSVPSDCFSLDNMECPANKDIKNTGYNGESMLALPPPAFGSVYMKATCKYTARIEWDKTKLFLNIMEKDALEKDILTCGPYQTKTEAPPPVPI